MSIILVPIYFVLVSKSYDEILNGFLFFSAAFDTEFTGLTVRDQDKLRWVWLWDLCPSMHLDAPTIKCVVKQMRRTGNKIRASRGILSNLLLMFYIYIYTMRICKHVHMHACTHMHAVHTRMHTLRYTCKHPCIHSIIWFMHTWMCMHTHADT